MPPTSAPRVSTPMTTAVTTGATWKVDSMLEAIALDCVVLPTPKVATTAQAAKATERNQPKRLGMPRTRYT